MNNGNNNQYDNEENEGENDNITDSKEEKNDFNSRSKKILSMKYGYEGPIHFSNSNLKDLRKNFFSNFDFKKQENEQINAFFSVYKTVYKIKHHLPFIFYDENVIFLKTNYNAESFHREQHFSVKSSISLNNFLEKLHDFLDGKHVNLLYENSFIMILKLYGPMDNRKKFVTFSKVFGKRNVFELGDSPLYNSFQRKVL